MPKKPEAFSKVEDKFKLSLVQMQKRFVDLEVAISELRERLESKDLKAVADIKQRMEDLEDLITVEQAGILELKKMMEDAKTRFETMKAPQPTVPPELNERISGLDEKFSELSEKISGFETKLAALPAMPKVDLEPITNQITALKEELNERIRRIEAVPAKHVDVDFIISRIDTLKASIDDLINKKVETDFKVEGLEKSIAALENRVREASSEEIIERIESNRKDLGVTNARIESMGKIIKNISETMQQLESSYKKMESFEKLSLLSKEVEDKIERFKFIEDELHRLSSRMEMMYSDMDKRIDRVKGIEKGLPKLSEQVSALMKEVDRNRVTALSKVGRKDVHKLLSESEKKFGEIESKFNERLGKTEKAFGDVERRFDDIIKRIDVTRNEQNNLMKQMKGMRLDEVKNIISVTHKRISKIENDYRKGMEDIIALINRQIAKTKEPSIIFDAQLKEIIDRIVFLESRLAAIETSLRKSVGAQPIILE